MLFFFNHLFIQDKQSEDILKSNGIPHCSISGDTRFDRVKEIADHFKRIEIIDGFTDKKPVIVAGSTWPDDEQMLATIYKDYKEFKLIIAPHEIHEEHIKNIIQLFPQAMRYSKIAETSQNNLLTNVRILIIDNVGMLSRLYQYSSISYIGGGFTKDGIHNTLEAAVYGKPVVFGPNYQKYREANELIDCGGGFSVTDANALEKKINELLSDIHYLERAGNAAGKYIINHLGATGKILNYIQANRLLTRL